MNLQLQTFIYFYFVFQSNEAISPDSCLILILDTIKNQMFVTVTVLQPENWFLSIVLVDLKSIQLICMLVKQWKMQKIGLDWCCSSQ